MAKKKSGSDSVAHFFGGTNDDVPETTEQPLEESADLSANLEGEIAVDVYQTDNHVVIVSPIAGVQPEDIEISAADDTLTISGERKAEHTTSEENVLTQEIYWGAFSRTVMLPVPCVVDKASASFKNGVLTVRIPKSSKAKKKVIRVKTE